LSDSIRRDGQVLVLELDRRRQASYLGVAVILFMMYAGIAITGVLPRVLGGVGMVVFGTVAVIAAVAVLRNKALARLSPEGLTLEGGELVPWASISSVAIGLLRPRALFWTNRSARSSSLPRIELLPTEASQECDDARSGSPRKLYGTPLVLVEKTLRMSAEEVVSAAQSFAPLAVTYVRGAKPKRPDR